MPGPRGLAVPCCTVLHPSGVSSLASLAPEPPQRSDREPSGLARSLRGMKLGLLLASLVLVAGCGSASDDAGSASPAYDITILYWPGGRGGEPLEATLTCNPDGGSH